MVFSFFGFGVPGRDVDLLCASLLRDFFLSSLGSPFTRGGRAVFYIHFERSGVCMLFFVRLVIGSVVLLFRGRLRHRRGFVGG